MPTVAHTWDTKHPFFLPRISSIS